jgi:hypothetical protein
VLAPAIVDAIDKTLDVVLAPTAAIMAARPKAKACVDQEISERVVLCRPARMRELLSTQRVAGQVPSLRALHERDLVAIGWFWLLHFVARGIRSARGCDRSPVEVAISDALARAQAQ